MAYRPTKATLRKLLSLAQGQGGYFTAKQAAEIGYDYPHLDYHVGAGNFERVGHGVYRLPEIPVSEHDDGSPFGAATATINRKQSLLTRRHSPSTASPICCPQKSI
jgi:predicted transcriptional regulator of viral defense system